MVTLVLACQLTASQMLLCNLRTQGKNYRIVIDTGSNVTSFVDSKPLRVTLSNGKKLRIKPHGETLPVSQYNLLAEKSQRIDGIVGQDVLSKFRWLIVDYSRGRITLVK
jgi:hypothetical protein